MGATSHIFVALPVLDELDYLPRTLKCIFNQNYKNFTVYIIVNQPDNWWKDENKINICLNNEITLEWLYSLNNSKINIIDKSSKGHGWKGKEGGIGYARKTVMDSIIPNAQDKDLIVSLDADTTFGDRYFEAIHNIFQENPMAVGLSVPYYHNLTNDEIIDRAILRYEIYMRYYSLNLWRINSPYNFTALGSAIVVPVWAYKSVEGLSPKQGGEDFYFLQKLRNFGELLNYLPEKVHPAARLSNRVAFGTGPALIKGTNNNWNSYPIYNSVFFDEILETYNNLDKLYVKDIQTPLIKFINNNSKNNVWDLLRKNYPDKEKFVKACHEKINALRILQYLKYRHNLSENISDENKLIDFFKKYFEDECYIFNDKLTHFSFENENIKNLDKMRNFLFIKEEQLQKGNLLAKNGIFVNN